MLTYDSFEAHVTDTVNASFQRENTELVVIPGGLTSLLYPLDKRGQKFGCVLYTGAHYTRVDTVFDYPDFFLWSQFFMCIN